MIRKILSLCAVLLLVAPLHAASVQRATLIANFDLDGAAASDTAVHSTDAVTDTAAFTIDAQPDTPRPLQAVFVDADSSISACTYTVVGTTADGTERTETATLTGGSGNKAISGSWNWATVTSASVGTCTGEGAGDTVSLGTTSTIPDVYVGAWGSQRKLADGSNLKDPFAWNTAANPKRVKTTGSATTVVSYTASSSALAPVNIGDLVLFSVSGQDQERVVVTNGDDDTITINRAIDLSSGSGHHFRHKTQFFGPDTNDGWFGVGGYNSFTLHVAVDQMAVTGGIDVTIQCRIEGAVHSPVNVWTKNYTAAGADIVSVTLATLNADSCRVGLGVGTNDDASDTTAEIITAYVGLSR